jgi:tetratricopeptide (TPR) repeat protein
MEHRFHKILLAGLICLSCQAVNAQSKVVFLGGGYPQMCSSAAHAAENPQNIDLTGTRLSATPLEICTLAITSGALNSTELAGSYNNRGVLLFAQGNLAEALNDFEQALQLNATLADVHVNRGFTLISLQRWADSIESFDRGIALAATQLDKAHFNRGLAHEELGNVREAYFDYLKASELNPEWDEPKRELARFSVSNQ